VVKNNKNFKLGLGGGFSCLVCGKSGYDGYSRSNPDTKHWTPYDRTTPCTNCGYDAPAEMKRGDFQKFIKWRDSLPNKGGLNPDNYATIGQRLKEL
jgi:hypothetical protein